jgi:hypothetical protein
MMWRRLRILALALILVLSASLYARDWKRIGLETVNHKSEMDSVSVGKNQNFQYIRLCIHHAGIVIERWVLEYRDGSAQHIGFFGFLAAGKETPPVRVRRGLKKIHFKYHSPSTHKKGKVEVLGS